MKPEAVRELSEKEMKQKVKDLRMELLKMRFLSATNQQKNPLKKRSIRKDIARILTIIKEKEIGKARKS